MKVTWRDIYTKFHPYYPIMRLDYDELEHFMTPESILELTEYSKVPEIIRPTLVHSFDDLVNYRNEIRHLNLVPVKNPTIHQHYNSLDKKKLLSELKEEMPPDELMLKTNDYPYALPPDVDQHILWYGEKQRAELKNFIGVLMTYLNLEPHDIVTFERPLKVPHETKLIRGTFREMNHIHLWTRKKS